MTPLKDTLEVASSATEAAGAAERTKSESGGLRADAVSLEVPVKVHGSRVTEVVRGTTPHTEPFEEQTATMIVFPQGGVLRMSTAVAVGQMMVLTNLKSGHDAICRVAKVRNYAQSQSYVEVEFTNRQHGYWGVRFPGDAGDPPKSILAAPAAPISSAVAIESESLASRSSAAKRPEPPPVFTAPAKPLAPLAERAAPPKKESSFVSIGSQEDVQPAAAATAMKAKSERPASPAVSLSIAELRGDSAVAPPAMAFGAGVPGEVTDLSDDLAETSQESAAAAASVSGSNAFSHSDSQAMPQRTFGARFDSLAPSISETVTDLPAKTGANWFLIVTGIAALLLVAVGGAFYFRILPGSKPAARIGSSQPPAASPVTASNPGAAPAATSAVISSTSAPGPVAQTVQPAPSPATPSPAPPVASATPRAIEPAPVTPSRATVLERPQAPASASQKPTRVAADLKAGLNAHPVSSQRSATDEVEPAPSLDAAGPAPGALQGLTSAAEIAPPPPPATPAVKIGGDVKPPKLVSSPMPVYPAVARSAGVGGNVVLQASINAAGAVVATKIISGPPLLRQAAVDAVKHWKYQPATLNGSPVAVDITVTMSFHN